MFNCLRFTGKNYTNKEQKENREKLNVN